MNLRHFSKIKIFRYTIVYEYYLDNINRLLSPLIIRLLNSYFLVTYLKEISSLRSTKISSCTIHVPGPSITVRIKQCAVSLSSDEANVHVWKSDFGYVENGQKRRVETSRARGGGLRIRGNEGYKSMRKQLCAGCSRFVVAW